MNSKTQCQMILDYLKQGKSITPIEALNMFGCFRLTSRIWDLKQQGHDIEMKMVDGSNGKSFASYSLIKKEIKVEEKGQMAIAWWKGNN